MSGRSKGEGRPLHGRLGQGRLRAFALGSRIIWDTVADSVDGKRLRSVVRASSSARNDVDISDPESTDAKTGGTRFTAEGREGLDRLDADKARDRLTATFAPPYLIARPPTSRSSMTAREFNPGDSIEGDTAYEIEWWHEGVARKATLRIIEWKQGERAGDPPVRRFGRPPHRRARQSARTRLPVLRVRALGRHA